MVTRSIDVSNLIQPNLVSILDDKMKQTNCNFFIDTMILDTISVKVLKSDKYSIAIFEHCTRRIDQYAKSYILMIIKF